jgi:OmcA/MtrC family decaheme c-type cytochrome
MRITSVSCRTIFLAIGVVGLMLSGCGKDGSDGAPGPQGVAGDPGQSGPACATTATALTITVDKVTIGTPAKPVVDFTVTNESGYPFCGLTENDLRFNIAKLTPENAATGDPSVWQNYIVRSRSGRMEGYQETVSNFPDATLVNHLNGKYTYTFATDLNNAPCPGSCTTAEGKPLDVSYEPSKTHRIGIQQGNRSFPLVNGTYDFVPAGGAVVTMRDIVQTPNCNECHNRLRLHGTRIETKFCVTCHNPGSWFAKGNSVGGVTVPTNTTVDFKVFIHKIHRSEELHQLVGSPGGSPPYPADPNQKYLGFEVLYPQPLLNCTKCHTDSDSNASRNTPQGGNWGMKPSMEACGSCHDDIYFDTAQISPERPWQNTPHPGGVPVNNFVCHFCHDAGGPAGTIASSHTNFDKVWRAKFKFNILEICGVAVGSNPVCVPGSTPTMKFSVEDPTGGTHGYAGNSRYNIKADPEFTSSAAALTMDVAWDTRDYNNTDGSTPPAQRDSVNLRTSTAVTDDGTGIFTVDATSGLKIPDGTGLNGYSASGSGAVGIEGHPAADFDGDGTYSDRASATSEVAYFGITDTTPFPRRVVVDVATKCDNCHDVLSLHGGNRNNNAQVCVLCHNPKDTDILRRGGAVGTDGKLEESIDFKRLIHAIHGNSEREKPIVVYGYSGNPTDFSEVEFPGILSDCETCHVDSTYTLADRSGSGGANWEQPAQNGILGSIINTGADPALRSDDKGISPTAAVCSACHDNAVVQAHMEDLGSALFDDTPTDLAANIEQCVVCHGPGALADVEVMHDEATARAKQGL